MSESFLVAAVQASPIFLDRAATVEKACSLIAEAGARGSRLAVFPEGFIPAYPLWCWFIPAGETHALREALYAELLDQSVTVPGEATDRLCAAARDAGVAVAIGINERNAEASGTTLYNSLLWIGADGRILGSHRKLVPTAGERLIHGQGDGSTLAVYDLPIGRLGGLICWENYMPLARYALYAWGVQIYAAPTWDRGEPWLSTLRHIAKEGRVYVIGCCTAMLRSDVPDRYAFKEKYLPQTEWLNPGDSTIVDPDGKLLVEPVRNREEILYAEVDPKRLSGPRWQLDVAGHYGRPDVFELTVRRDSRPMVRVVEGTEEPRRIPLKSYTDLMRSFLDRSLDANELQASYLSLFKSDATMRPEREFQALDGLFAAVDSFCADPSLRDERDLNEEELRESVRRALQELTTT